MKNLLKILLFGTLLVLGGCYTQVALREPSDWDRGYTQNDDEYGYYDEDTTNAQDSTGYYDDYYSSPYYNPYRRYYFGYYPPSGFALSFGYYNPWYYDYYDWWWCGTCLTWNPWWYSYGYYGYYPYNYYGYYDYYPRYYPYYKLRNYTYTHLRDNDGGRGYRADFGTRNISGGGRNSSSINSSNSGRPTVDLSNTTVTRNGRDSNRNSNKDGQLQKSASSTPSRNSKPAVRQRAPRNSGSSRPAARNNSGSRGNRSSSYYRPPRNESPRSSSPPAYVPKSSPRTESGNTHSSYSPPSYSGSSSRGSAPSSSGGSSTRGGGSRGGRR